MSGSDPTERPSPVSVIRCPRCGGVATTRSRRGETRNPFLAKKKPEQLTCEDCGLDFDRPADASHDGGRDSGRDSGRSPWSKS